MYLIFQKKKDFKSYCFTVDWSTLLFIITVHIYCLPVLLVTIQKLYCKNSVCNVAIQNSKCISTLNIPSVLYCNTISSNTKFQVVCFTTILQYNVAIQSFSFQATIQSLLTIQYLQPTQPLVTIQNIVLQYKQPSILFLCNTKIVYFNTLYQLPALFISQYKWTLAIQNFFFSQYKLDNSPKKRFCTKFFFFSFAIILK